VLTYPRLQRLWRLTPQDIQEHIDLLEKVSHLVHPIVEAPVVLEDPNDDPVIYTAVSGKADALCTLDRDFFHADVIEFAQRRGFRLLTDLHLLSQLREGSRRFILNNIALPSRQKPIQ
ncbi:MAG: putative toxin-antitoxin system toxin component, PIN family, partial [Terriglobia bacterium]